MDAPPPEAAVAAPRHKNCLQIGIAKPKSSDASGGPEKPDLLNEKRLKKLSNLTLSQVQHRVIQLQIEKEETKRKLQEVSLSEEEDDSEDELMREAIEEAQRQLNDNSSDKEADCEDDDGDDAAMAQFYNSRGQSPSPSHWAPSQTPVRRGHGKIEASLRRQDVRRGHGKIESQRSTAEELQPGFWRDVHNETTGFGLSVGMERKSQIDWQEHWAKSPSLPPVTNLVISNLTLGGDVKIEELAQWCKEAPEDIVIVSVLPSALKPGNLLESFSKKATVASLNAMLMQHSGKTDTPRSRLAVINTANALYASPLNAAVAAATADKFIFSIWKGGFIVAHRMRVNVLRWREWEVGPSATQFGTLTFSLQADKMQQPNCRIGIVKIPDNSADRFPEDNVWPKLARWIRDDAPFAVTGYFGKDNDDEISHTAVAANATVDHRVRVSFNVEGTMAHSPGGFLIFAACTLSLEEVSAWPQGQQAFKLSNDIVEAFEYFNPTWLTANSTHYIGNVKHKQVAWEKHREGMLNCRLYVGEALPGKERRRRQTQYNNRQAAVAVKRRKTSPSGVAAPIHFVLPQLTSSVRARASAARPAEREPDTAAKDAHAKKCALYRARVYRRSGKFAPGPPPPAPQGTVPKAALRKKASVGSKVRRMGICSHRSWANVAEDSRGRGETPKDESRRNAAKHKKTSRGETRSRRHAAKRGETPQKPSRLAKALKPRPKAALLGRATNRHVKEEPVSDEDEEPVLKADLDVETASSQGNEQAVKDRTLDFPAFVDARGTSMPKATQQRAFATHPWGGRGKGKGRGRGKGKGKGKGKPGNRAWFAAKRKRERDQCTESDYEQERWWKTGQLLSLADYG
jgi:hypothetical protein